MMERSLCTPLSSSCSRKHLSLSMGVVAVPAVERLNKYMYTHVQTLGVWHMRCFQRMAA